MVDMSSSRYEIQCKEYINYSYYLQSRLWEGEGLGIRGDTHHNICYRKHYVESTTTTATTLLRTDDYNHYAATTTGLQLRTDIYDHYSSTTTDLRFTSYVYGLASSPLVIPTVGPPLLQSSVMFYVSRDIQQQLRYHSFYHCRSYARSCLGHSIGDRI